MPLDTIREKKESALKAMQHATSSAAVTVDDGIQAASTAALSSAVYLRTNTERAMVEGQVCNTLAR